MQAVQEKGKEFLRVMLICPAKLGSKVTNRILWLVLVSDGRNQVIDGVL